MSTPMTRRGFGKLTGTGLLALAIASTSSLLQGCSAFTNILNWIPVGINAVNSILVILGPLVPPGAVAIMVLVKAAFADLAATVTQYNNDSNPADKATLVAKIRTILADIVSNFQSFLNALNLGNNPIEGIVIGLAGVVLSAIEGFLGQLPAPTGATVVSTSYHLGARTIPITPKLYKNVNAFKSDFNSIAISSGHPEIVLH